MYEQLTGKEHLKFQSQLHNNSDWNYVEELAKKLQADLKKPIKSCNVIE